MSGTQPLIRFAPTDGAQRPVIVLGAARSGTSAMSLALRRNTRYVGYGEGHLIDLFPKLAEVVNRHYLKVRKDLPVGATMLSSVPAESLVEGMQAVFVEIARNMAPTGYWTDKTPGPQMVRATPALRRIWPDLRVVFMKRRPLENIESRRRKFPDIGFREHCMLWAESMTAWEEVREELKPVSLEVEQLELANHPEIIVGQLTTLLTLSADESERLLTSFINDRPERTTTEFAPTYTLDSVGWSNQQRETFLRICGGPMERFGYDTGALSPVSA
jgi:hypothetical protein